MNDKKPIKSGINKCVNIERIHYIVAEEFPKIACHFAGQGRSSRGVAGGRRHKGRFGKRICSSVAVVILRLLVFPGRVFVLPFGLKCSGLILLVRVVPRGNRMLL